MVRYMRRVAQEVDTVLKAAKHLLYRCLREDPLPSISGKFNPDIIVVEQIDDAVP